MTPPSPRQPTAVEIYDTTLRDGSQLEGISLTVDDKLRIAEQLDYLGVHYIEGGWPGANPKDDEFFRRAADRAATSTPATLVAFGSTRRVEGQGRRRRRPCANLRRGRHAARCASSASAGTTTSPRRCGPTLDEGVAMVARLGRVPARPGPSGVLRRRALLRRLQAQPRVQPAGARGRGHGRGRPASCCATPTAARCPSRSSAIVGEVVDYFGTTSASACTCTTTPAAAWPTRWPACGAAPRRCRARSTATASAPATATSPRSSRTSR